MNTYRSLYICIYIYIHRHIPKYISIAYRLHSIFSLIHMILSALPNNPGIQMLSLEASTLQHRAAEWVAQGRVALCAGAGIRNRDFGFLPYSAAPSHLSCSWSAIAVFLRVMGRLAGSLTISS